MGRHGNVRNLAPRQECGRKGTTTCHKFSMPHFFEIYSLLHTSFFHLDGLLPPRFVALPVLCFQIAWGGRAVIQKFTAATQPPSGAGPKQGKNPQSPVDQTSCSFIGLDLYLDCAAGQRIARSKARVAKLAVPKVRSMMVSASGLGSQRASIEKEGGGDKRDPFRRGRVRRMAVEVCGGWEVDGRRVKSFASVMSACQGWGLHLSWLGAFGHADGSTNSNTHAPPPTPCVRSSPGIS